MIALFDMDGTLFWGDSQLRFARWILKRRPWRRLYLGLVLPAGILRALHILNTEQMKRLFLSYLWCMTPQQIKAEVQAFCQEELYPALYPEVLEKLRQHQAAGDTTVLCSASPHWWTSCLGEMLGFTHSIGTPVMPFQQSPLMPPIEAPGNNKGANKLIRLAQLGITRADYTYTDSRADLPMMGISDKSVLVNPSDSFTREWGDRAEILRPQGSKSKIGFTLGAIVGIG